MFDLDIFNFLDLSQCLCYRNMVRFEEMGAFFDAVIHAVIVVYQFKSCYIHVPN